jgi:hypothetical protein
VSFARAPAFLPTNEARSAVVTSSLRSNSFIGSCQAWRGYVMSCCNLRQYT